MVPKNGRIIIVDDSPSEAAPLMTILSRERIPFNYYSGLDLEDFPTDAATNPFRVLFLDLNIFEANQEVPQVISVLHGILRRLIPDNPTPYLLIIWSKKGAAYREALAEHFQNALPRKKPAKTLFLVKGDYFDIDPANGDWIPQADSAARLRADLHGALADLSVLGSLFVWENLVHANASATLNEFTSFYPIDPDWDSKSKVLIYKLAYSYVGTDRIATLSDARKLAFALGSLNSFLSDRLESDLEITDFGQVANIADGQAPVASMILAKINSKLHISSMKPAVESFEQGNVYLLKRDKTIFDVIVSRQRMSSGNADAKLAEIIHSKPRQILLDITPVCDYAQDKGYVRLLHGVMVSNAFAKYFKNVAFTCQTPIFYVDNKEKFILLDFRFIETVSQKTVAKRGMQPIFRLRKEICTDIQSQLSNQINRPGISNV